MALVTITGDLVRDESGRPDPRPWTTQAATYQDGGGGGGVITPGEEATRWWPKAGVLTIRAGAGKKVYIGNPDGKRYLVTIPVEDSGLWSVIEAGVAYSPDTAQELLAAAVSQYVEEHSSDWTVTLAKNADGFYVMGPGAVFVKNADGFYEMTGA